MSHYTANCARRRACITAPSMMLAALVACSDSTSVSDGTVTVQTSFEQGLGAWTTQATDVLVGGEEIDWSIAPSSQRASVGAMSIRFDANNRSDAAKLWIQRSLEVQPNTTYRVSLTFDFATADEGAVNLWRILAGAFGEPPNGTAALQPAFRGETGKPGSGPDFVWLTKEYSDVVASGSDGTLTVVIGVWGTSEFARTYFVDNVRIDVEPVSQGA